MQHDTESPAQLQGQLQVQLQAIETQLATINKNLLNVFWIVGFFALLYFGLMIYLMFFR